MGYEKKYKDVLPYIRDLVEHNVISIESAGKYFPELIDSDEKIRNATIAFVEAKKEKVDNANKVEPKFNVDDWITNSIETVQITGYDIDYGYQVDYKGNLQHRDTDIIEKEYHLWTIQDAKDGDILANDSHILILKELGYTWASNGKSECLYVYCGIKPNGNFELGKEHYCFCGILYIHPATKEQRNLLFSKMEEAGWSWNLCTKELSQSRDKDK